MAIANHLAISRWAEQIDGPAEHRSMEGRSVYAVGDTIYSYGRHFPMAEIMRDKSGRCTFVLVNGDTASVTTAQHQSKVRNELVGVDSLIVPFSALNAAGIDFQSIQPLEILGDTRTTIYQRLTLARMRTLAEGKWTGIMPAGFNEKRPRWPEGLNYTDSDYSERMGAYTQTCAEWAQRLRSAIRYAREFRDGDTPIERVGDDYLRPVERHWLGEAIFSAKVRGRRAKFLSAFDHNEIGMVYFLCELPKTDAKTVAEAFEALAPPIVKRAQSIGIDVLRQGDIFAIPCDLPAEISRPNPYRRGTWPTWYVVDGQTIPTPGNSAYNRRQRNALLGTDHTATEVLRPDTGEVYARGIMRHEPAHRRPDHARIKLDGWHLIVQNTVPRQ